MNSESYLVCLISLYEDKQDMTNVRDEGLRNAILIFVNEKNDYLCIGKLSKSSFMR